MCVLRFTVASPSHLSDTFLLPKIPRTSEKQDTVVIQERVGITVSEEVKTAQGDS